MSPRIALGWSVVWVVAAGCSLIMPDEGVSIDRPDCSVLLNGTPGDDRIEGDPEENSQDCIDGLAGNDILDGGDDDDVLIGGEGADTLRGSDGQDWLYVDPTDTVDGGGGIDTLVIDANLLGGNDRVDLAAYTGRVERIEAFRHDGTLVLTPDDVEPMVVAEVGRIVIDALPLGAVTLEGSGWTPANETVEEYGGTYDIYYGVAETGPIDIGVSTRNVDASGLTP